MFEPSTPELIEADGAFTGRPNFAPPIVTSPETLYRHAGWQARRDKIRRVLAGIDGARNRCERWDNCGSCATIEYSAERQKHRVCCWHCKDRWCVPCQTRRRVELVRIIHLEPPQCRLRMVTVTLRGDDSRLRPKIKLLKSSFRKLTRSKWWKAKVVGGVAVLETKIGKGGKWHPHLHAIVDSEYLVKNELAEQWKIASGGSYIVDVKEVKEPKHAAGYLAKYVTKGVDADVINNPDLLKEAIEALRGSRAYDVFGSWRGQRTAAAKASAENDPDEHNCSDFRVNDWTTICSLREYIADIRLRLPYAIAIQLSLQQNKFSKGNSS